MPYLKEEEMYLEVCNWLIRYLQSQHPKAQIHVYDSSHKKLARLIQETGLIQNLPAEWPSWDIQVDVVGFAITRERTFLYFVECKNFPITLRDLSQLLGYSRVALPENAFLIAPQGMSDSLRSLLLTYHRADILEYRYPAGQLPYTLTIATWDEQATSLDLSSLVTGSRNLPGRL